MIESSKMSFILVNNVDYINANASHVFDGVSL